MHVWAQVDKSGGSKGTGYRRQAPSLSACLGRRDASGLALFRTDSLEVDQREIYTCLATRNNGAGSIAVDKMYRVRRDASGATADGNCLEETQGTWGWRLREDSRTAQQ